MKKITIYWFRNDLRLADNHGLYKALQDKYPVLPVFILDNKTHKTLQLNKHQSVFLNSALHSLKNELEEKGSTLIILRENADEAFKKLIKNLRVENVFAANDYDPHAIERDEKIKQLLAKNNVEFHLLKDGVIFEKNELLKKNQEPYTVFSPYKKRWKLLLAANEIQHYESQKLTDNLLKLSDCNLQKIEMWNIRATESTFKKPELDCEIIKNYHLHRDYPAREATSKTSAHLRFGTVSIRRLVKSGLELNETWLDELIWRDFFKMIFWHFPDNVKQAFKPKYNHIPWINHEENFEKWCNGQTGYPMVDAGMKELNRTGFMHNRVRMITASFLTKHLLTDWQWGETYFAQKLTDHDPGLNNGNWQWVAGSGCDAVPYFRVFNPQLQAEKFDPEQEYIKKWIPEFDPHNYLPPIIDHKFARQRAINTYKKALSEN